MYHEERKHSEEIHKTTNLVIKGPGEEKSSETFWIKEDGRETTMVVGASERPPTDLPSSYSHLSASYLACVCAGAQDATCCVWCVREVGLRDLLLINRVQQNGWVFTLKMTLQMRRTSFLLQSGSSCFLL